MNALQEKLLLELRQTRFELEQSLMNKHRDDWMTPILEEELQDVEAAIQKLTNGTYGQCEVSGELLPEDIIKMVPTIRSSKDTEDMSSYFKKPILPSF
ncbi:hypothetical protein [Neobacillus muris]|uniref:hypothetical protein n=1 Tax=Neobacillus muris TaxID=2941334 RepID=UPI00203CD4E4|nr:hypothetical protein [Neobacillus muris]